MGAGITQRITVALAGNPNVGKSTLFNALTGMRQHTGNWPGKTVGVSRGVCRRGDVEYVFYDLPGTYSLSGETEDECVAADFLEKGEADCTVVVCDGNALERSLILALQILSQGEKAVLCVNLMDEAHRHGRYVSRQALEAALGVPVVLTAAGRNEGIGELLVAVARTALTEKMQARPQFPDPVTAAGEIAKKAITCREDPGRRVREQVEKLLVSRRFGVPLLFAVMAGIIWLTVWGANYPSAALERLFYHGYEILQRLLAGTPAWLRGLVADGMYLTAARVIAVMLPPMAIFFPLFTFLEDVGYLPRMAFLMDRPMARCAGCGKQALTMCMGLGCNAAGVVGCRIIDSPREKLIAVLTNSFMPCNGRFPTIISLISLFFAGSGLLGSAVSALILTLVILLGVIATLLASKLLSKTLLRGVPSSFTLELPPYRRPQILRVLVRSLLDRTLFVLGRAVTIAAPAGLLLWLIGNVRPGGIDLLQALSSFLDAPGRLLGMDGVILLAFLLGLPANELVLPVMLMCYLSQGQLTEPGALASLGTVLRANGWTGVTGACFILFSLLHWPCATTLLTIRKETGSWRYTALAAALPTVFGLIACLLVRILSMLF